MRGSGALGQQFATIVLTNTGQISCWLVGYPAVRLRAKGTYLGAPAAPARSNRPVLKLAPVSRAEARLHGPTTCNAALSDTVRISAPGQSTFTDVALVMRGCALIIDAFTASRTG